MKLIWALVFILCCSNLSQASDDDVLKLILIEEKKQSKLLANLVLFKEREKLLPYIKNILEMNRLKNEPTCQKLDHCVSAYNDQIRSIQKKKQALEKRILKLEDWSSLEN